jgi:L-lactate dehydrogenase complex protein LldG
VPATQPQGSRENILHRVRTALGRSAGQAPSEPPAVRLRIPEVDLEARIACMRMRIEALAGVTHRVASSEEACALVAEIVGSRPAVASNSPYLAQCGIASIPGVRAGIRDVDEMRAVAAASDVGITSADYALADTGTLVMISSAAEARLVSLLPILHVAVVPVDRILTGLDELFTLNPRPADRSSSMVLITGPSRTADIEQILVRGVHGPGQITVIIVG